MKATSLQSKRTHVWLRKKKESQAMRKGVQLVGTASDRNNIKLRFKHCKNEIKLNYDTKK